jgi:hypothetical protein
MLIDWADRSVAVLDAWSGQSEAQRTAASLQIISDNLDRYPNASPTG